MTQILAREVILAFPNFNKPLHIYAYAANTLLVAIIINQNNKHIAFYSKKPNLVQTPYTTTEKE